VSAHGSNGDGLPTGWIGHISCHRSRKDVELEVEAALADFFRELRCAGRQPGHRQGRQSPSDAPEAKYSFEQIRGVTPRSLWAEPSCQVFTDPAAVNGDGPQGGTG